MYERCAKCGAEWAMPTPAACPKCGTEIVATAITNSPAPPSERPVPTGETAITETPAPFSELPILASESTETAETRNIANPQAMGPPCPPWLLAGLSTLLCAMSGAMAGLSRSGRLEFQSTETYVGAAIGLIVGFVLAIDHVQFVKELTQSRAVADDGMPTAPAAPPSEIIPIVMLMVPVVAAGVMWFGTSLQLTESIVGLVSNAGMLTTSVLGYFSIRQIALFAQRSKVHQGALGSPAYMYLAMLALWLICFPVHFLVRKRMGGRNFIVPGLIATGIAFVPIFQPYFVDPELPRADSAEVLNLVKQLLEKDLHMGPVTLKNASEESFDTDRQIKIGRCTMTTHNKEEEIAIKIDWQNRQKGIWQVSILPSLPPAIAPEVADVVRGLFAQGKRGPVNVRNVAQVSYDSDKQIRVCQATIVSAGGEVQIRFAIEWDNRDLDAWRVRILP